MSTTLAVTMTSVDAPGAQEAPMKRQGSLKRNNSIKKLVSMARRVSGSKKSGSQKDLSSSSKHGVSTSKHGVATSKHGVSASKHGLSMSKHDVADSKDESVPKQVKANDTQDQQTYQVSAATFEESVPSVGVKAPKDNNSTDRSAEDVQAEFESSRSVSITVSSSYDEDGDVSDDFPLESPSPVRIGRKISCSSLNMVSPSPLRPVEENLEVVQGECLVPWVPDMDSPEEDSADGHKGEAEADVELMADAADNESDATAEVVMDEREMVMAEREIEAEVEVGTIETEIDAAAVLGMDEAEVEAEARVIVPEAEGDGDAEMVVAEAEGQAASELGMEETVGEGASEMAVAESDVGDAADFVAVQSTVKVDDGAEFVSNTVETVAKAVEQDSENVTEGVAHDSVDAAQFEEAEEEPRKEYAMYPQVATMLSVRNEKSSQAMIEDSKRMIDILFPSVGAYEDSNHDLPKGTAFEIATVLAVITGIYLQKVDVFELLGF